MQAIASYSLSAGQGERMRSSGSERGGVENGCHIAVTGCNRYEYDT